MSESKDTTSFFRKVVKFVANPSTEWADVGVPANEARETEYAKGELKAMIERKRRNDFVRKREFDMLRKVRREGLTSEQLAALGGSSSRIDESDSRADSNAKAESGVKAKIDEIEQQMVGDSSYAAQATRRNSEFFNAPTVPAAMPLGASKLGAPSRFDEGGKVESVLADGDMPLTRAPAFTGDAAAAMASFQFEDPGPDQSQNFVQTPVEAEHDPELDEAVIAFANADFEQCEQALVGLIGHGGARSQHAETWLVLFDLYRAIGQQPKFETLANEYARQFGWSAPQWFSMPKLVAEAVDEERPRRGKIDGQVGWVCPDYIDADAVAQLSSACLQMPLPWVFDWTALRGIDAEGCARLSELFRNWIGQALDMLWIGGDRLFGVLVDAAPNGVRDADPAYWRLRLDALRMTNRPDEFDGVAIDYCVTYEVSPPSWEPARCLARISDAGAITSSQQLSMVGDGATSYLDSRPYEENGPAVQVGTVELSGQLVGDIGATLKVLDDELGSASMIHISCVRLIRVDFIAAGDLLNWVLARRAENRSVRFIEAHRMVALFFGAMGINEHAQVRVCAV